MEREIRNNQFDPNRLTGRAGTQYSRRGDTHMPDGTSPDILAGQPQSVRDATSVLERDAEEWENRNRTGLSETYMPRAGPPDPESDDPDAREILQRSLEHQWMGELGVSSPDDLPDFAREYIRQRRAPEPRRIIDAESGMRGYSDVVVAANNAKDAVARSRTAEEAKVVLLSFADVVAEELEGKNYVQRSVNEINRMTDLAQIKRAFDNLYTRLRADLQKEDRKLRESSREQSKAYATPKNIQEVAERIMEFSASEWQTGGEHELVGPNGEFGEKHQDNFVRWVQMRMLLIHSNNPEDKMEMWERIGEFGSTFRSIHFGQIFTNKERFFKDAKTGKYMGDFYKRVFNQVWLFNSSRNFAVDYVQVRGDAEGVAKIEAEIARKNLLTKTDVLKNILETKGVRPAILSYYYLPNIEMMKKILEGKNSLFNNERYKERYIEQAQEKVRTEELNNNKIATEEELKTAKEKAEREIREGTWQGRLSEQFFDKNGNLIAGKENEDAYAKYINIFNLRTKDLDIMKDVQDRIRFALMDKFGLDYHQAEYAETFAYTMSSWTGIAANNDINGIGFDAWTKILKFGKYNARQKAFSRVAEHANPYLDDINQLGVNMWLGITDETDDKKPGRSLLEIVQGGLGEEVDLSKEIGTIRFATQAMSAFVTDHLAYSFRVYQRLISFEEMGPDKFTTINPRTGMIEIDHHKAVEIYKGLFKDLRYAYSTYKNIDFTKKTVDDNGHEVYIAELMFGKSVLYRYLDSNGNIDPKKIKLVAPDGVERDVFWKEVLKKVTEAELEAHSRMDSPYKKATFAEREKFLAFMEEALTTEDIKRVRKMSNNEFWSNFIKLGGMEAAGGLWSGFGKFFKIFFGFKE